MIFQFVTYHDTGYVDSSGAKVPEADVVGTGEAWILSAGYLSPVRWEKRDNDDVTVFRGADGRYARLLPGRTWVELVPLGEGHATDRPADANDEAKPVAPPLPDGTGPSPPETTTTTTGPDGRTTTTTPAGRDDDHDHAPVLDDACRPTTIPDPTATTTTSTSTHDHDDAPEPEQEEPQDDGDKAAAARRPRRPPASVASGPASAAVSGCSCSSPPGPARPAAGAGRQR